MRRAYADTPTGQVHFRELGSGVPLLCLHKTPSSSIQFTRVAPLLADAGFRVIAVDTPGFGGSDPLPGGPTIPGFTAAVLAVLDQLGIERTHVLGHHTGSLTAVELAARHAHRVDSVILGGLLVMRDDAERDAYRPYLHTYAFDLDSRGAFLDRYPRGPLNDWLTRDDPEQYWLESVAYMQGARTFTATYECTLVYDAIDALPTIRRPTLFLDQEQGRCHEHTVRVAPLVPGSEYVCLPGTSEGCLDAPEEFAAAALAFLRRHVSTS
jgi:pimeloyl-ACP methyl ester carboxylesterase